MPESTGRKQGGPPKKRERDARGRFTGGTSGNPAGRPKGARNRATVAAQELLDGEAGKLTRKAVELALAGDTAALRLCLDRVLPARKGSPVHLDLPPLQSTRDAVAATGALVQAVADGDLSPAEAESVSRLLEIHRRAIETEELEERLAEIEERLRQEEERR